MGLSVYAYRKATPVEGHLSEMKGDGPLVHCQDEDENGDLLHVVAFAYQGFERSMEGLEPGRCYVVEGTPLSFHAGSCTGYGEWRDDLSQTILGKSAHDAYASLLENPVQSRFPFLELICFADNEGTIGPLAAARLYADFVSHRSEYLRSLESDPAKRLFHYDDLYEDFTKAFELASNGGLVEFH